MPPYVLLVGVLLLYMARMYTEASSTGSGTPRGVTVLSGTSTGVGLTVRKV